MGDCSKVAMYIRLSKEDTQSGSMSIETQEKILHEKLSTLTEYADSTVLKFVDNGFTGTNLDRPALNDLLSMVQSREISCLLLKDLSRLGRDMLKVGYLVESVFPLFGTRLIAVTDEFDSLKHSESTGGLDVTFRFLMSEHYSRDLSKKIQSAKESQMKRGELVTMFPLYGYKLDEKRKFTIDEAVADNVRLIFNLKLQGYSTKEIVQELFHQKIPTPSEHRSQLTNIPEHLKSYEGTWSTSGIVKMLRDERYIGTYVSKTRATIGFGETSKRIFTDESQWVKIPNHFTGIISKEDFLKVQEIMPLKKRGKERKTVSFRLKGKAYCGICNRRLNPQNPHKSSFRFACLQRIVEFPCYSSYIMSDTLNQLVFAELRKKATYYKSFQPKEETQGTTEKVDSNNIENLKAEKMALYEAFVLKKITAEVYQEKRKHLSEEVEKLTRQATNMKDREVQQTKEKTESEKLAEICDMVLDSETLTEELDKLLIKKVLLYPDGTINIEYMFEKFNM